MMHTVFAFFVVSLELLYLHAIESWPKDMYSIVVHAHLVGQ